VKFTQKISVQKLAFKKKLSKFYFFFFLQCRIYSLYSIKTITPMESRHKDVCACVCISVTFCLELIFVYLMKV